MRQDTIAKDVNESMTALGYSDLTDAIAAIRKLWCLENGYTDPFCHNAEWWAFPTNAVIPVKIKTVMGQNSQRKIQVGRVTLFLFPDGSLGKERKTRLV
ncbi:MAG: hypothetical protein AAFY11_09545 [Cyanobacteria bacterium J06641_5]